MVKSIFSHPEIFTISLLLHNSFCIYHYNLFSGSPMPILRAWEARDEVVDTNTILKGWECDTDTRKHHPEIPEPMQRTACQRCDDA
jgi:hypothetical protein